MTDVAAPMVAFPCANCNQVLGPPGSLLWGIVDPRTGKCTKDHICIPRGCSSAIQATLTLRGGGELCSRCGGKIEEGPRAARFNEPPDPNDPEEQSQGYPLCKECHLIIRAGLPFRKKLTATV